MADPDKHSDPAPQAPPRSNNPFRWVVLLLLGLATLMLLNNAWDSQAEISYSRFLEQLRDDNIAKVTIRGKQVTGDFRRPLESTEPEQADSADAEQLDMVRFTCTLPPQVGESLLEQLDEKRVVIVSEDPAEFDHLFMILSLVALVFLFFFAWTMIRRTRDQMMGGGMLGGVTKSPARRYDAERTASLSTTWRDWRGEKGSCRKLSIP